MGRKQRRSVAEQIAAVRDGEPRVILATGSYIGEGFDDARLDTLFLAMPISWKGTLQQYVGRLHRVHHHKRIVEVFDYVEINIQMLARMFDRRVKGYSDMGYTVLGTMANQQDLPLSSSYRFLANQHGTFAPSESTSRNRRGIRVVQQRRQLPESSRRCRSRRRRYEALASETEWAGPKFIW